MQPNLSRHSGLFVSRLRISARIICGDSPSRASRARRRTVSRSRRRYAWMVSNSRNIPSRGATPGVVTVSSVVGAVAKVSNLRSATSRRALYMHVHNSIRDNTLGASSSWPNDSRLVPPSCHLLLDSSTPRLLDSPGRCSMPDYGHDLQFGFFLDPTTGNPGRTVEIARILDDLGYDLIGIQDHPYHTTSASGSA